MLFNNSLLLLFVCEVMFYICDVIVVKTDDNTNRHHKVPRDNDNIYECNT